MNNKIGYIRSEENHAMAGTGLSAPNTNTITWQCSLIIRAEGIRSRSDRFYYKNNVPMYCFPQNKSIWRLGLFMAPATPPPGEFGTLMQFKIVVSFNVATGSEEKTTKKQLILGERTHFAIIHRNTI